MKTVKFEAAAAGGGQGWYTRINPDNVCEVTDVQASGDTANVLLESGVVRCVVGAPDDVVAKLEAAQ